VIPSPPESPAGVGLLLAVLRHHMGWCDRGALEQAADNVRDWQPELLLAAGHQVHALLRLELLKHARDHVPETVAEYMQRELGTLMMGNLRQAWRLHRIMGLFDAAGIRALAYKGPSLAALVFGGQVRLSTDLDFLLPRMDALRARDLLLDQGFHQVSLPADGDTSKLDPFDKAFTLRGPGSEDGSLFEVDLHWRLFFEYFEVPPTFDELWSRRQSVAMPKGSVPTFGFADYAFILGVHGHKHCWAQLKWLVEFSWMLTRLVDEEWERFERTWHRANLLGELALALTLVAWLLGIHAPRRPMSLLRGLPSRSALATAVWQGWAAGTRGSGSDVAKEPLEFFVAARVDRAQRIAFAWRFVALWWARRIRFELHALTPNWPALAARRGVARSSAGRRALTGVRRLWNDLRILVRAVTGGGGDRRRIAGRRSAGNEPRRSVHPEPGSRSRPGAHTPPGGGRS